ncbi:ABC transporter ATP-binding protein [Chachezhania sediminis]|uniref:ABC transporter ATP-binding protein n=1 Tax=Chachezhania sediminis TaxID=2599291 RepID=UPI00131E1DB4|nr:ABC transporter ATP-binding protein [Chachezhania sediminis]
MSSENPPKEQFVRFEGVRKSYDGTVQVVRDLNLSIREGEFLTLLGPSGSGKTTTLMMLAGFEKPTAGKILFDGQVINDMPTYKRNFGMVFQNYALFPHMTVAENVAFPLRMHRFPKSEQAERVTRALDMVQLHRIADRHPTQLSGGQQQRVALARALVFEPKMVLMDEPLGALDKQLREHMQLEIRALHEKLGLTMLYVTHDQSEALTMSDRVAIFNDGEIQHIDAPSEVYDRPRNAFVAKFMGENNAVEGTVTARDGDVITLRTAAGRDLHGTAVDDLAIGQGAQVLVRPEQISLGGLPADGFDSFEATVADKIYHGDHLRIVLEIAGLGQVTATFAHAEAELHPEIGQTLTIRWRIANALAFAPDGPAR